jgi:Na+/H+-dicarboxylate symporter
MTEKQNGGEGFSPEFPKFVTVGAVVGILLGFGLGAFGNAYPNLILGGIGAVAGPVGEMWTKALLLVVVPLIVCYLILAAAGDGVKEAAQVGGISLGVFATMMLGSAAYTLLLAPTLLRGTPGDVEGFSRAVAGAGELGVGPEEMPEAAATLGDRLVAMIPDNVFETAARGDLIGLILISAVFGFALSRIGPAREQVLPVIRATRDAVFVVTYWVILAIPVGAFALAYDIAFKTGMTLAGILGYYFVVHLGLLIVLILLLYPLTGLVGRSGMGRFARAVWPAQGVAMSTRSSLASVPALMKGARDHLGLPEDVVGLTIPLGASTFKLNTLVSSTFKLLFLAHVYGINLDPTFLLLFVGTQILLSPGVPGIPSGGYVMTLPLYVAVGIPVEGVILLKAMDGIPDIFKTMMNTTGYMSAAIIVARFMGWNPETSPGRVLQEAAE